MKRVLITSQYYPPEWEFGGPVRVASELAGAFLRQGCLVTVVTMSRCSDSGETSESAAQRVGDVGANAIRVIRLDTRGAVGKIRVPRSLIPLRECLAEGFDLAVVVGLYDVLGLVVARAARVNVGTLFLDPCGMLGRHRTDRLRRRLFRRLLQLAVLPRASFVIASSRLERDLVRAAGVESRRVLEVRYGTDRPRSAVREGAFRERLGVGPKVPLVLWLGRIEPIKQLELLISALARLPSDVILAVVGPVEQKAYFESLKLEVAKAGLDHRVRWCGGLFDERKWEAIRDANVLALVSRSENWGLCVTEAIGIGTRVVVTRGCGVAETVQAEEGEVVEANPREVAEALLRCLRLGDRATAGSSDAPEGKNPWDDAVRQLLDAASRASVHEGTEKRG